MRTSMKCFLVCVCLAFSAVASAQKILKVHKSNGEVFSFAVDEIDSLTVMDSAAPPSDEDYSDYSVRFTMTNIYAAPVLAGACVTPGEFCCIRTSGNDFVFAGVYNSNILSQSAVTDYSSFSLGLCGLIVGVPSCAAGLSAPSVVCYDMVCPNCYSSFLKRSVALTTGGRALCSYCNRYYDLSGGGMVTDGREGRSLFRYRVVLNGQTLVVNNQPGKPVEDNNEDNDIDIPALAEDRVATEGTLLSELIKGDKDCSLFCEALQAAGLMSVLDAPFLDETWNPAQFSTMEGLRECPSFAQYCHVPQTKASGHTLFVCTDEALAGKYGIGSLDDLYGFAQGIYGGDREGALRDLLHYCILERKTSFARLTAIANMDTEAAEPASWYGTMLPHSLLKVTRSNDRLYLNAGDAGRVELFMPEVNNACEYGSYYHADALPLYDAATRHAFASQRIRTDFYTLFPELENASMRCLSGSNPTSDAAGVDAKATSYIMPGSYLSSAALNEDGFIVYQNTHNTTPFHEGDCIWLGGKYDMSFLLPAIPEDGVYEIRMGYTACEGSGICQLYLNGAVLGIPFDMRPQGTQFSGWESLGEHLQDEQGMKEYLSRIRNWGNMNAPYSSVYYDTEDKARKRLSDNPDNLRRIIARQTLKTGTDNILRIRSVLEGGLPVCLDYIEIVPKCVYDNTDKPEDIY